MTTTLYDPAVDSDPFALGLLGYGQLPVSPISIDPPSLSATDLFLNVPDLLDSATTDSSGITLDTDGSVFNGLVGLNPLLFAGGIELPTGRTFAATANTGYAGFTNYTIDLGDIDPDDIQPDDLANLEDSLELKPVNPNFPTLDPDVGFTIAFDLTILNESSAANRAGFSLIVVSSDNSKEIELGFKTEGADHVFAQGANFQEAESSSATLDFSTTQTYSLDIEGDTYSLEAGGVEILSGSLRDYNFDPLTSDPPLPEDANPYELPNFIFLGDNTDQAHAEFTLGEVSVLPLATTPDVDAKGGFFDFEAFLRFENPDAIIPTDEVGGIQLAQLFDENFYLENNVDVAAAVAAGRLTSGYEHFVRNGITEGRSPSQLYDETFYRNNNADVDNAVNAGRFASGLEHFLVNGHREGRDPSSLFDQADYLTNYGDVDQAVKDGRIGSAFEHYIEAGAEENRLPLSLFDEAFYLDGNPDVEAAVEAGRFASGFEHFASVGQTENRRPSQLYDEASYLDNNGDVATAVTAGRYASGFDHYQQFGRFEGRQVF